jgi:hypothetical protein
MGAKEIKNSKRQSQPSPWHRNGQGGNTMKLYSCKLLKANSVDGIKVVEFCDYPEAHVMNIDLFREFLKDADETDIFALIMPEGTDGEWEKIDTEYGIHE